MISTNEFKNGISIILDDTVYQIISFQHIKPGKGGAFVRTKLKAMLSKAVIDRTFRAGEKVEQAYIENKKIQYLYFGGNTYFFMDTETFEEVTISQDVIGGDKKFLKDGMVVSSVWHKHDVIEVILPTFIVFTVKHTEPGIRGDTAKSACKPATLDTGATVQVPLFVNAGDKIKVDTRSGEYVERA
ncbi:MAG: elongation factor P [Candidatus Omnitrophota bacterium]